MSTKFGDSEDNDIDHVHLPDVVRLESFMYITSLTVQVLQGIPSMCFSMLSTST